MITKGQGVFFIAVLSIGARQHTWTHGVVHAVRADRGYIDVRLDDGKITSVPYGWVRPEEKHVKRALVL